MTQTATDARELARALIYTATGDVQVADDWCSDLAGELAALLARDEPSPQLRTVRAWLDSVPAAATASFFAAPAGQRSIA